MYKIENENDDLYQYLFDKYYRLVYTTAYRIVKNKEDCEEITQDAFSIGFKNMSKIKNFDHFKNYILKVAYNLSINRAKKNNARYNLFPTTVNEDISSDKDIIGEVFEDIYFKQIMDKLPDIDREVMLLSIQGYKVREIAQLLGISVPNAKIKLHRTRKLLMQNMEGELIYEKRQSV
ncbi:DNA-directed RNA polymerase sigma-70 factor [Vallitalea longa]|uniref:DNA-directed RNA polymerase sigma-70 factor n=1 Tax=Vallitalea longa TaxID=2936439 RepID=A0A9W5Y845_9FIRM|nr:sigma-70 family RNA polymerase sigma factor [Vallitalea longa]GKX28184.1 DNA-directed RNA polymerase sigma-70 factor [Vallitalea longa]